MNLNYLTQRKHLFKKRVVRTVKRLFKLRVGTVGLFTLKKEQFELLYLRTFKKIIKNRHLRGQTRFKRRKF